MAISNVSSGARPGVCTSTTRPTAPFEGQLIYETDTDMLAIWNGTAWRYIAATTPTSGTVLQVVSTTKTDPFTSTGGTTWTDVTGLSASITPKSSSSKIFVNAVISGTGATALTNFFGRLVRDSTAISIADTAGSRRVTTIAARDQGYPHTMPIVFLDSPATTSSVTYKIQVAAQSANNVFVNRSTDDSDNSFNPRTVSSITLMEIAG